MIFYKNSNIVRNLFMLNGSVFPFATKIAFPVGAICAIFELLDREDIFRIQPEGTDIMNESAVWGGFTFLAGFLIVFRTSIAYSRFWDGVTSTHKMRAEWFDATASIFAFCKHSSVDATPELADKIDLFQNTLVRLVSLLHAVALAEIEDFGHEHGNAEESEQWRMVKAFTLDLIDDCFLDDTSLMAIKNTHAKPELVFQWVQQLVVENIKTGVLSIPPPILSRSFQELANGMVEFHEAQKVSSIPFPFPYAQTCDFLLVMHALMTPVVMTQWVNSVFWAFVFTFIQVFIMWSLKAIAVELENPFGEDANDLDDKTMQEEMNTQLELLISKPCQRTPRLKDWVPNARTPESKAGDTFKKACSLMVAWERIAKGDVTTVKETSARDVTVLAANEELEREKSEQELRRLQSNWTTQTSASSAQSPDPFKSIAVAAIGSAAAVAPPAAAPARQQVTIVVPDAEAEDKVEDKVLATEVGDKVPATEIEGKGRGSPVIRVISDGGSLTNYASGLLDSGGSLERLPSSSSGKVGPGGASPRVPLAVAGQAERAPEPETILLRDRASDPETLLARADQLMGVMGALPGSGPALGSRADLAGGSPIMPAAGGPDHAGGAPRTAPHKGSPRVSSSKEGLQHPTSAGDAPMDHRPSNSASYGFPTTPNLSTPSGTPSSVKVKRGWSKNASRKSDVHKVQVIGRSPELDERQPMV